MWPVKIRWLFTITLIVTFLSTHGVSYGEDEQPCQPDAVVMFGNGVLNNDQQAEANMEILLNRLNAHISGTELEEKISYNTAHNPSAGTLHLFYYFRRS